MKNSERESIHDTTSHYFQKYGENEPRECDQRQYSFWVWKVRRNERRMRTVGIGGVIAFLVCLLLQLRLSQTVELLGEPLTLWGLLIALVAVLYVIVLFVCTSEIGDNYDGNYRQLQSDIAEYRSLFGEYPDRLLGHHKMVVALQKLAKRVDNGELDHRVLKEQYDLGKKFHGRFSMPTYKSLFEN